MKTSLSAVVLCAGQGTRMKSQQAKVLHPVLGRPLCYYPLKRALEVGASRVVAVVGHQAAEVQRAVESQLPAEARDGRLQFALQREQRGTADAVKSAKEALAGASGQVMILYGDTPLLRKETLEALLAAHGTGRAPLSLITTRLSNPHGYGRIVREGSRVVRVVEQKDASEAERKIQEVNAGIYLLDSAFLWEALGDIKSQNAQGEFYLTDLVQLAAQKGEVAAVSVDEEETAGVNDRVDLSRVTHALRTRINQAHMRAGVTFLDPESTSVDEDVVVGADCVLGPQVSLQAGTRLSAHVVVGQGCVLTDTQVAEGTVLKPYSVLESAVVGRDCQVGPFSRLRPGTQLEEGVHLGNFVETKKARIGKGSKVSHLSYLGDAKIGAGVNVGAGTITCNYDGVNKFETVLEDGVFIGSDTQLVAPVTVRAGSYVGAGTTVTQDVPAMSLALSRAPLVVKEGWVARKKAKKVSP